MTPEDKRDRLVAQAAITEAAGRRAKERPEIGITKRHAGFYGGAMPKYPKDAPRGAKVLSSNRHVVELALFGKYLGLFLLED